MKLLFLLQLLLNALFGALVLIAGVLIALTPWSQGWYDCFIHFFSTNFWAVPLIGILLAIFGLKLFLWSFSLMHHGSYKTVAGKLRLSVDEGIIQKYFSDYLTKRFPNEPSSAHVVIKNNQLVLMATIPVECTPALSLDMQEELRMKLQDLIGHTADFSLQLTKSS